MSTTYSVSVNSPCSGTQTVSQISSTLYRGAVGSFTLVVLSQDATLGWVLTVYDLANPLGSCYPFAQYAQVTPDTSDPTSSQYGLMDNGSPNTSLGDANVS